ncbi:MULTISPECIES: ABC-F family ATP-binding cassette domain-containing protein [unclassified Oceanispirochaeta]|uniref:ABC-F family ATP-binding cassette domain-containing protein n=1 Tax=unclassified Oceanispirochaeta TaxID=2635722 RepID=UPI000E09BB1C|nr:MULTISPECIES: ATP-binding cassette domain-containing protein [unclassified Oceanispirochaeta]MBF9018659.1 ATP-binding cassette domain-containing protein [Oceanispirochaeta sp. M2]NPD75096.1 ATP-binding cassette domain-containing protein [Oceanispirochaeta sp. M1]RDG29053.1 ATP-binding cassette domain-containing protein [Oceanispirochaeta sp. M1]
MITASNITLSFGKRFLFKDVNIKFTPGNCYGLIGANGSGKSTFLKILSGEIEQDSGDVILPPGERLAVLAQDHYAFNEHTVMHTVIMGHKKLYSIMVEKDAIYMKEDFTDEDGMRASELEGEFADLNGWESESEAATLLAGLGVGVDMHDKLMKDVDDTYKVRILLAQAIFGNPEVLLLDEPTNHLDIESIRWLENFLYGFQNTVIVVSHDRHFLNKVCTHIADIDYNKIQIFAGNYMFWQQASQLSAMQRKDQAKKSEAKAAELKSFIQRFSANASKSKQATSRKKELDKLELNELPKTSRRFPFVGFEPDREPGTIILEADNISKTIDGEELFKNWDLKIDNGDKIGFVGPNNQAKTAFMEIIMGNMTPDTGKYSWGVTTSQSYFPKDNTAFFDTDENMTEWLRKYSEEQDDAYVRGFLGRMLFSGDESLKKVKVLSGGEKVRCMLSRMMLSKANVIVLDDPTAHLDLESITSLNDGLMKFNGIVVFSSHDHQFINTIANRIIEFTPGGVIDRRMTFEEYLDSDDVRAVRDKMYGGSHNRMTI